MMKLMFFSGSVNLSKGLLCPARLGKTLEFGPKLLYQYELHPLIFNNPRSRQSTPPATLYREVHLILY